MGEVRLVADRSNMLNSSGIHIDTPAIDSATDTTVNSVPSVLQKSNRRWMRSLKAYLPPRLLAPLWMMFPSRSHGRCAILTYHRVSPMIAGVTAPTWNVTPEVFQEQMSGLLSMGYRAIPLSQLLECVSKDVDPPEKSFVVTFDDGFEGVHTFALPILRKLWIPATVFLATQYLNSHEPFPSDDWVAKGAACVPSVSWRPLTTVQCMELQASGLVELGGHTHTHADFRNRPDDLYEDLILNCTYLKEHFGIERPSFAFPYGTRKLGFSGPILAAAVRKAGMSCALTTEMELADPWTDPYDWGRFNVESCDTAITLAVKIDGWLSAIRRRWQVKKSTIKTLVKPMAAMTM